MAKRKGLSELKSEIEVKRLRKQSSEPRRETMASLSVASSPSTVGFGFHPNYLSLNSFKSASSLRTSIQMKPIPGLWTTTSSRQSVVMMAKRDEELKEIRGKSNEEIDQEVQDLKGNLFILRYQKSYREDVKPTDSIRIRKRELPYTTSFGPIARMLTVRREREIEEGIGRRLSRKLDKKRKRSIVLRPPPLLLQAWKKEADENQKGSIYPGTNPFLKKS